MTLDGAWQFRGWLGDEWRWHVAKPWDAPGWLPARVPGSVVDDLMRAGEVPDVYFERNSRLAEWAAGRTWLYRTHVRGGALELSVDHEATVFVDGEEVARHVGSFTPFSIDVPDGEHLLAVAIHPAPPSEPQVGKTSRVRVHKSRMGYGWDFCPRLVHQGIWRPVGEPRSVPSVTFDGRVGRVEVDGELVLEVEEPELWWPNGSGEQRLYDAGGFAVGFRTVELRDDYTLVVNGVETPIRGWNWVPLDVNYGVPRPEKLERLLRLAERANVNLLRVWGGGVIESDEFYSSCDRFGLLVWQEFSQSSSGLESVPSDDREFVAALAADARQIVPSRAWHPSLAIWCGGNELDADDATPAIAALHEAVRELDPDRAWLPTSPVGELDVHGPWEHQGLRAHYEHYDSHTSRLHSEFGVEGMTNRAALDALIAEEHRWPADRTNPIYEHLGAWWNNAPLVQECFGGRLEDVETMRRASQWLQYDGLRYAVEATLRRGAGVIPWQFNESFPNAWCTCAVDWHGEPKPAYHGVARAYAGAPAAQFATCAWGGLGEVRAVALRGRLFDLDGRVVAEGEGDVAAPLDAFAYDIFLLDVGGNRYVMSRTENLAPLLDLPPTTLELAGGVLRNTGAVAAIGVVTDGDVLDLLPGEAVSIEGARAEGWNARL
ncbi:MAG TPA: glycoside hydrolase family 2 TIM barrel-domain containing protein [Gaiellaceae bacterium]